MRPLPSAQRSTLPQVSAAASLRRSPASESTATSATSKRARAAAYCSVSVPRPRGTRFAGGQSDHPQDVTGQSAGLTPSFVRIEAGTLQSETRSLRLIGDVLNGPLHFLCTWQRSMAARRHDSSLNQQRVFAGFARLQ